MAEYAEVTWARPRRAVYGDGWKITDRHTVVCLDPEDGEMGIKEDGKLVVRGILPETSGDSLASRVRRIIRKRANQPEGATDA